MQPSTVETLSEALFASGNGWHCVARARVVYVAGHRFTDAIAALTIARMPALTGSGSVGQAATTAAK
ncbi:MAG: hypothetical protein ACYSVY_02060 [Planctomycetota bacterium]|jgi:hypothetical protein